MSDNPERTIDCLNQRSIPRARASLVTPENKELTEKDALPVHTGGSVILKGLLNRPDGQKDYSPRSSISDKDNNAIMFSRMSNQTRGLNSGIIIGGKMTRQNTIVANVWIRLWLYLQNPAPFKFTATEMDGQRFNVSWARRDKRIGYLDFNSFEEGTDCSEGPALVSIGQTLLFELTEENKLYGLLEARSGFTMLPLEQVSVYLYVTSD